MRFSMLLLAFLPACGPMTGTPDAGSGDCRDTSKSPANVLENPGFECDTSPATWSGGVYGTFELVGGGRFGRAAQLTVKDALGARFVYAKDFAVDAGMKTYCVQAWLKGTAPFMRVRVLRSPNNTAVEQADQIAADWARVPLRPLSVTTDDAAKLQLVFEIQTGRTDGQNGVPGQTMLIDDVDVWESTTTCTEAR